MIPSSGRDVQCSNCGKEWFQRTERSAIVGSLDDHHSFEVASESQPSADAEHLKLISEKAPTSDVARVQLVRTGPIALLSVGVLAEVEAFRERIRGNNEISPEVRLQLNEFLDLVSERVGDLVSKLPPDGSDVALVDSETDRSWLEEYRSGLVETSSGLICPSRVAGVTVPTGIVLGCTAIGALLGQPIAGAVVGGLIANHTTPDKALQKLLRANSDKPTSET